MVLSSTKLVPELAYWFDNFVTNSVVNKNQVPSPVSIPQIYLPQKSFIELLFNEDYPYTEYNYLYTEHSCGYNMPYIARNRLFIYPGSAKYLDCDETGTNSFVLKQHDFVLLDALLAYRIDSTNVTIVDSTSVELIDTTAGIILKARYGLLGTELSKLIYLYLDLKIYNNYSHYDNNLIVSSGKLLESSYEVYVLDKIYKVISTRGT